MTDSALGTSRSLRKRQMKVWSKGGLTRYVKKKQPLWPHSKSESIDCSTRPLSLQTNKRVMRSRPELPTTLTLSGPGRTPPTRLQPADPSPDGGRDDIHL